MRLIQCDRCGVTATLDEASDSWASIAVMAVMGFGSSRPTELCPGCQTGAERAQLEQARNEDCPF
ncbi:MAG: hypothetical protein JO342_08665 [Solirubrobacterales bacterium]|nr:hypothetical protein [Solirubrobacterales bacterium]